MSRAQRTFLLALTISLPAYGLDCLSMTTPDEAMECCKSMGCHYHKHRGQNSQDCCKTTPQMRGAATQPVTPRRITSPPIMLAVVSADNNFKLMESYDHVIAPHSHDPPLDAVSIVPLRL